MKDYLYHKPDSDPANDERFTWANEQESVKTIEYIKIYLYQDEGNS
jgi:hypothetical protein